MYVCVFMHAMVQNSSCIYEYQQTLLTFSLPAKASVSIGDRTQQ